MAIIPEFFMKSVVAIGVMQTNQQMHWIGTGFLVGRKEDEDITQSTVYLITNKHVVKGKNMIYVRFNSESVGLVKDYPINLIENGLSVYTEHPCEDTDIIAMQINPNTLVKDHSEWSIFDLNDHSLTLQEMKNTGVEEGTLVYALGFPMGLVDAGLKTPIVRLGCISKIKNAFYNQSPPACFYVDAQTFPGNSGGPIVSRPELVSISGTPKNDKANLIGVLSAYIPYRDVLTSNQTNNAVMIREENSGITIVHPVDRVKEVVELEYKRVVNLKKLNNA